MHGYRAINTPPHFAYPAISVVIPLYNAEEYIGECLDSFLMQTFPYFEVIVVDDCSTDNSVAVVESYIPKFGGRLRLTRTAENSGSAGRPRNIGFGFVRGEYVFFADADDFILLTGLETLYKAAKKFNADVVYMSSYYRIDSPNEISVFRDAEGDDLATENLEDTPTLTVNDPKKAIHGYLHNKHHHTPWSVFTKRNFLIENAITFPEGVRSGEDGIWNIHIRCFAKRFLRLTNPIYFRRCYNPESITRKQYPTSKQISQRMNSFSVWLQALRELSNKLEFLTENPDYAYDAFKVELGWILNDLREYRKQMENREIFKTLYRELAGENHSPNWMVPFFFAFIDEQKKSFDRLERASNNFKHFITGRIDVRFFSKTDNAEFSLISVSDEKASVTQPDWIKQNGTGYMIQSFVGDLELVGNTNSDGQIKLSLRGMDVRDPQDSSKRIPCWIDFTKLSVNDGVVFDAITPVWHNKSYDYDFNVRAGQEIRIKTEWLPRLKGIDKLKEMQAFQSREINRVKEAYRALTGRVDIKLTGVGDIKLLSVSDERAKITQPDWILKDGSGYVIESIVGAIKVAFKATEDGLINLNLRGMDVRNPKDRSKRIPYWVDFTSFTINGRQVLNKIITVWHNEPYTCNLNVKAGMEVVIELKWHPHMDSISKMQEIQASQRQEINRLKKMLATQTQEINRLKGAY